MKLDTGVISQWRTWKDEYHQDKEYFDNANQVRGNQQRVIGEIHSVLKSFFNHTISVEDFRATFHQKTITDWDYFGMKGMSGAMVLNKYVKHIPDQSALTDQLCDVLFCPQTSAEGRKKMELLSSFLNAMMKKNNLKLVDIQPGRIPFFLSGFWHFQSSEDWPFYYLITRKIFEQSGIYEPKTNPIDDYFYFRDIFLTLKSELKIDSFELDYICGWIDEHKIKEKSIALTPLLSQDEELVPETESLFPDINHAQVQWMLAKIGNKMGYNVWIASNDRSKKYQGEILGSLSVNDLPHLGLGDDAQKRIKYIDVIWFKGSKQIVAAFEVEMSTQIYSGILRMSDFVAEAPNTIFPLYIIAPENRMDEIKRQLNRPTFQSLGLDERCGFFSDQELADDFNAIMKFGTDISAIDEITRRVSPK